MRYLVILFLLSSLSSFAQEPTYVPMKSNYLYKGIKMDSLFILPVLDTASARKVNGNLVRQSDAYYWYDSTKWVALVTGGGGTDTTSLSNRINQKVDSVKRSGDSVYYYKNGIAYFGFKDSVGNISGFVPYTGATQDVDLGNNGLDARFIKIEGTAGTGHIDLKHQSSDGSAQGNSSILYANSQGYLKWKNDNLYYSTLAMPQTADRVYTYQNKNYTLGDSADIEARVKYTDTANMLSPYLRKADTASLSNRIDLKLNISDTANMLASYLREADTASLSNRINSKLNISDTSVFLRDSDSILYQTKYRSDTARTNIYTSLGAKVDSTGWIDYSSTSTITGWSSFIQKIIRYKIAGNMVFINVSLVGTSNNGTTTFTLPFNVANYTIASMADNVNNGIFLIGGVFEISASSNLVTCYRASASNNSTITSSWTNSGSKQVNGQFFFEKQ